MTLLPMIPPAAMGPLISAGGAIAQQLLGSNADYETAGDAGSRSRREMRHQRRMIAMQNKQARQFMADTEKNRYSWLVSGAQKAGFNPLTVLGATGGAMSGGASAGSPLMQPVRGSSPTVGDALGAGVAAFADSYDPVGFATRQQQLENMRKLGNVYDAELAKFGTVPVNTVNNSPTRVQNDPLRVQVGEPAQVRQNDGRPYAREDMFDDRPRIPIRENDGTLSTLDKKMADAMGYEPWDQMPSGDMTHLLGEIAEVETALEGTKVRQEMLGKGSQERKAIRDAERLKRQRELSPFINQPMP